MKGGHAEAAARAVGCKSGLATGALCSVNQIPVWDRNRSVKKRMYFKNRIPALMMMTNETSVLIISEFPDQASSVMTEKSGKKRQMGKKWPSQSFISIALALDDCSRWNKNARPSAARYFAGNAQRHTCLLERCSSVFAKGATDPIWRDQKCRATKKRHTRN